MKNQQKIGVLPSNYREQKSLEQAAFQNAAKGNRDMILGAMVFKGVFNEKNPVLLFDPYLNDERSRYGY